MFFFVTDGAGNMAGEEKGVASRIAQIVPDLFWFHCIYHCINLTIRTTCTNAAEDMTRFVQEISNTFAFSNIEHAKLQVIQTEMELEENKILRFAPTRWRSLGKWISRIIKQWDALFDFYKKEYNEKKTLILKQFEDPLTKPKLQFLAYFVQR